MNGGGPVPPYARRAVAPDPERPAARPVAPTPPPAHGWDSFVAAVRAQLEPSERPVFDRAVQRLTDERRQALLRHCSGPDHAVRLFRAEIGRPTTSDERD